MRVCAELVWLQFVFFTFDMFELLISSYIVCSTFRHLWMDSSKHWNDTENLMLLNKSFDIIRESKIFSILSKFRGIHPAYAKYELDIYNNHVKYILEKESQDLYL